MPVLSGRINFVPFSTTSKKIFQKFLWITAKMVKNLQCQKTLKMCYIGTYWTPCKKPHVSTWSRSRYTFFLDDPLSCRRNICKIWEEIRDGRYVSPPLWDLVRESVSGASNHARVSVGEAGRNGENKPWWFYDEGKQFSAVRLGSLSVVLSSNHLKSTLENRNVCCQNIHMC